MGEKGKKTRQCNARGGGEKTKSFLYRSTHVRKCI